MFRKTKKDVTLLFLKLSDEIGLANISSVNSLGII